MPKWLKDKPRTTRYLLITCGASVCCGMAAAASFLITLITIMVTAERYQDGLTYPETFNLLILGILMTLVLSATTFVLTTGALAIIALRSVVQKRRSKPGRKGPGRKGSGRKSPSKESPSKESP